MTTGDIPPPSVRFIGVYRVERCLGQGGMGKVYLAHDDRLERPVAIKQIRGDKAQAAGQRSRLQREARAVARLSHPAVAHVHDVVYADDGYSIVMEYVEGRNVTELLTQGKMDGGLAINVAIQVAQGLAAAHHLKMVHRDLKTDNVMVTPAGYAKILDFGLVKKLSPPETLESLTERGLVLGTVACMSPEQASGRPVDARSDLFSFGILLYEMFTGYSPFRRERWLESLESIKRAQQTPAHVVRPELPVELSNLIEWLLKKDPRHRPQKAQHVVDVLARIAATTAVGTLRAPSVPWDESHEISSTDNDPSVLTPTTARAASATPSSSPSGWRFRELSPSLLGMGVLTMVTIVLMIRTMIAPAAPRSILVLEPTLRVAGQVEEYEHVARRVLATTLGVLEASDRLIPISASQSSEVESSEAASSEAESIIDQARRLDAGEALMSAIACRENTCVVQYRRIHVSDGRVVFHGHYQVPASPTEGELLAETVAEQLRQLFPGDLVSSDP